MKAFIWYQSDSYLHRLNPLTKLAANVPLLVLVSGTYEPVSPMVVAALAVGTTRALGGVPWTHLLRPLGLAVLFSLGMFWTGAVFYAGPGAEADAPATWIGPARLTTAGLIYGVAMATRLLAILSGSLLFVVTTDPTELVHALIRYARLPDRIGYGVFAAYRFLPLFQVEFEHVRAAHLVRGAAANGGLVGRVREVAGYLIPLLAIAVRKGERVALAMDSRGFGALPQRTYYRTSTLGWNDAIFATAAVVALVGIAFGRGLLPSVG